MSTSKIDKDNEDYKRQLDERITSYILIGCIIVSFMVCVIGFTCKIFYGDL